MSAPLPPDHRQETDDSPQEPTRSGPAVSRRAFLGFCTLTATAAGALYWSRRGGPAEFAEQVRKLDDWWRARTTPSSAPPPSAHAIPNTKEVREFEAFLSAHPLRHLSPHEIIRPHFKKRGGTLCGLPPRELWPRIVSTLRAADELRHRLGVPLHLVVSAYRSPQYNAKCPGASRRSQHLQNRALDLVFDCPSEDAFAMARTLREEGFFKGGLGRYESFIHLDTRGRNATWGV
jgi:hypothetical protein